MHDAAGHEDLGGQSLHHQVGAQPVRPRIDTSTALRKYAYATFMQAQSDAQREKATELLQQIIGDAEAKGLLGSTNWAAKPLPKLAESDAEKKTAHGLGQGVPTFPVALRWTDI